MMSMDVLRYCTPDDIPREVRTYNSDIGQLAVGKAGKVGILDLELQADTAGKTGITRQFSQVPLQVQRALYLEKTLPGMAYVYVISPSGGILQGDRYRTDITLKRRAVAHMTTQGATRIYGMNANFATQTVNIRTDEGCYLEYVPEQVIPYKNSRYYQNVNLDIHKDSTLVYSEVLTPGRMAMNESFEYDICYLRMRCRDSEGSIRFLENTKIEPKRQKLEYYAILGGYGIVGTVYVLTGKENAGRIEDEINRCATNHDIVVGTSSMPDESGVVVRILGKRTDNVFDEIFRILGISRKEILGAEWSRPRKN